MSGAADENEGKENTGDDDLEETINVTELCNGFSQPSSMCYDADPDGWSIWSAVIDDDDAASGFSSALQIEWYDANGTTFFCDTHSNRIMSIQGDNRAYVYSGGEIGHYDGSIFEAQFTAPSGITVETCGAVLVADTGNHCIRRIYNGTVETIAGKPRYSGDQDGFGEEAYFRSPCGIAYDEEDGSIYLADTGNSKIKRITHEGIVETIAGNGRHDYFDEVGLNACFNRPNQIILWRKRLFITDTGNHVIREIDLESMRVRTLVGTGKPGYCEKPELFQFSFPNGICIRENNANIGEALLWIADSKNSCIHQLTITDDEEIETMNEFMLAISIMQPMNNSLNEKIISEPEENLGEFLNRRNSTRNSMNLGTFESHLNDKSPKKYMKTIQTKTKVLDIITLLGGEDDDDEMMKHGNKNGIFEISTMEQPMGLAFNTMEQELLCSDYYNNNIKKMHFDGGSPALLTLLEIPEVEGEEGKGSKTDNSGSSNRSGGEVTPNRNGTNAAAQSVSSDNNTPMSPLSPGAPLSPKNEQESHEESDDGDSISSSLSSGTGVY